VRHALIPVILSGGSGTRLWPLSSAARPKQFLPLVTAQSLFQDTLARLEGLPELADPLVICNEAHRFLVAEQLREIERPAQAIVLEPVGRNTAPAIALAALHAQRAARDVEPILLVLPADHVIQDQAAFRAAVAIATQAALAARLVTFGIVPTRPETGYGYLLCGPDEGAWSLLERFVEKPDAVTAAAYLDSGRYLWNSGMFVFGANAVLAELERHAPDILEACARALDEAVTDSDFTRLGDAFAQCRAESIDYAVMEQTDQAAIVPLDAGWTDVGSWPALREILPQDASGNVQRGNVILADCRDSYVVAESRLVAALGLTNCVIVETADSVLVMDARHAQSLRAVTPLAERRRSSDV
jgi:mannose-1-phosphate guanylyltransferase/mannose-6-phosphate isomerase